MNVLLAGKAQSLADARWEKPFMKAIYGGHVATAIRLLEKVRVNALVGPRDNVHALT